MSDVQHSISSRLTRRWRILFFDWLLPVHVLDVGSHQQAISNGVNVRYRSNSDDLRGLVFGNPVSSQVSAEMGLFPSNWHLPVYSSRCREVSSKLT